MRAFDLFANLVSGMVEPHRIFGIVLYNLSWFVQEHMCHHTTVTGGGIWHDGCGSPGLPVLAAAAAAAVHHVRLLHSSACLPCT